MQQAVIISNKYKKLLEETFQSDIPPNMEDIQLLLAGGIELAEHLHLQLNSGDEALVQKALEEGEALQQLLSQKLQELSQKTEIHFEDIPGLAKETDSLSSEEKDTVLEIGKKFQEFGQLIHPSIIKK